MAGGPDGEAGAASVVVTAVFAGNSTTCYHAIDEGERR